MRVPLAPEPGVTAGPGDDVTVTVLARIRTSASGPVCTGHSGATGLRLYYDSATRAARTGEFYLHSGSGDVLDTVIPPASWPVPRIQLPSA